MTIISVHRGFRPGLLLAALLLVSGCTFPRWRSEEKCVLDLGATKEEIVAHLNENVVGTQDHPGLRSWRSGAVRLHVDGIPMALPASIAVQAPRNFRLLVSNPLTGGQEVDIGSNQERFWIWSKESPQVMTASHSDVALAIQELEMPIHIHPDWLMEVFGVVPLKAEEFELSRPKVENGMVELVATRQSPLGEDVERVIRVNVCRGRVSEHLLRLPGGKILARARMDKYTRLPEGQELPLLVSLDWPDARMRMVMNISGPEANSPSLANNIAIWQMPKHGQIIDIGAIARARQELPTVRDLGEPVMSASADVPPIRSIPAKVRLGDSQPVFTPPETHPDSGVVPASSTRIAEESDDGVPDWARR